MTRKATPFWMPTIHAFALAAMVQGYPIVAGISTLTKLDNSTLSIVLRAVIAGCALFLFLFVVSDRKRNPDRWAQWAFICGLLFWALYVLRLAYETAFRSFVLDSPPYSYWIWSIGGCLIPFLGFARITLIDADSERHAAWMQWLLLAAVVIVLPNATTTVESDYGIAETGRLGLQALNPISMGHLGVSALLMALWTIFIRPGSLPLRWGVVTAILIFAGGVLTVSANSRGPVLALLLGVAFMILASNARRKYLLVGCGSVGVAGFGFVASVLDSYYGTRTFERFFGQSQLDDAATLQRFDLYQASLVQFQSSPIIGSGLEVDGYGSYPHNLSLEAFMTTGVIGGFFFSLMLVISLLCVWRVMRYAPGYGWLSLFYLQYLIGGQFSGSISESTTFWALAGALFGISTSQQCRASPGVVNRGRIYRSFSMAGSA